MSEHIFGTDSHHLVRTNDPSTSHDAAESIDTTRLELLVYQAIRSFGNRGCISDEVRAMFPRLSYSSVTARYKALLDKQLIVDTGQRAAGISGRSQRVLMAACFHK